MPERNDVRPTGSGLKLTYDDFGLSPHDGRRHEIIDGEHYVTPSPTMKHQSISGNLHLLIGSWLESHAVGRVFCAPLDVVFSQFDVVDPDLLYFSNERMVESPRLSTFVAHPSSSSRLARLVPVSGTKRSSAACTSASAFPNIGSWILISKSSGSIAGMASSSIVPSNCHAKRETFWRRLCCQV